MELLKNNNPIFSIMKGTVISFLVTIIALTIFSILLVYTNLTEDVIKPVIITVTGISILIGSSIGTRNLKKNGLVNGAIIGFLYILIIYVISSIINASFALNLVSLIMVGIGLIGGVFGRYNWCEFKIVCCYHCPQKEPAPMGTFFPNWCRFFLVEIRFKVLTF